STSSPRFCRRPSNPLVRARSNCGRKRRSRKKVTHSSHHPLACGVLPIVLSRCQPNAFAATRCCTASCSPSAVSVARDALPRSIQSSASATALSVVAMPRARGTLTALARRNSSRPAASASNMGRPCGGATFTKIGPALLSQRWLALIEPPWTAAAGLGCSVRPMALPRLWPVRWSYAPWAAYASLVRDLLEPAIQGPRPEPADGDDHDDHGTADEQRNSHRASLMQE